MMLKEGEMHLHAPSQLTWQGNLVFYKYSKITIITTIISNVGPCQSLLDSWYHAKLVMACTQVAMTFTNLFLKYFFK